MAQLVLDRVDKTYPGPVAAVRDLTLTVNDGELLVLVGPSGCGKSTTLRMVAGLETTTAGTVSIGGRPVNDVPPKDRNVAMVFQDQVLYPHMTVRQNMAFGLKLRRLAAREIDARVEQAAEMLEIGDILDRRPEAISGGQRQRVAVGRAIVRRPALFLLDEPLSSLDAGLRDQLRRHIRRLHRTLGITMLYVTHDQTEAMAIADRVAVLEGGRLRQVADPTTLYRAPADTFVARFIGSPGMNLLDGHLRHEDGRFVFVTADEFVLPLSGASPELLGPHCDRPLTLGIRPEDIRPAGSQDSPERPRFAASVDLVEPVGAQTHVQLSVGRVRLVSCMNSPVQYRSGERVPLAISAEKSHLFDRATGQRIAWK